MRHIYRAQCYTPKWHRFEFYWLSSKIRLYQIIIAVADCFTTDKYVLRTPTKLKLAYSMSTFGCTDCNASCSIARNHNISTWGSCIDKLTSVFPRIKEWKGGMRCHCCLRGISPRNQGPAELCQKFPKCAKIHERRHLH